MHWKTKFQNAFRGIALGVHGQSSFVVHFAAAVLVNIAALLLRCALWQWCVLLLCISMVLAAELMNSAIERLAKGLCQERNEHVGAALDIASASVLCVSVFAAGLGALIFISRLLELSQA